MESNPEGWFISSIADGLQRLYALALAGAPPDETLQLTAQAWADALWSGGIAWEEALDAWRIAAAFRETARIVKRWPPPAHLLEVLPPRTSRARLDWPAISEEERVRNRALIDGLLAKLKQR